MKTRISNHLREVVSIRAGFRCEYCLLHRDDEPIYSHEVDHVIAEKHFGQTVAHNLAFACFYCNRFKGTDIASIDPLTGLVVPLFNPRTQRWHEHFTFDGPLIIPLIDIGRATVRLLQMNRVRIVQRRTYLIQLGRYPK
ncbi:MAG: HNH endonuclease [Caldilineaceae bacterium]